MIGRTQLTHFVEDGSAGAAAHLIEVAEKKLQEALAQRNAARATIRKCRDEIHLRREQLRQAERTTRRSA